MILYNPAIASDQVLRPCLWPYPARGGSVFITGTAIISTQNTLIGASVKLGRQRPKKWQLTDLSGERRATSAGLNGTRFVRRRLKTGLRRQRDIFLPRETRRVAGVSEPLRSAQGNCGQLVAAAAAFTRPQHDYAPEDQPRAERLRRI